MQVYKIINLPYHRDSDVLFWCADCYAGVLGMTNRVYIFDTTLRDGEQSPGCSMTTPEKLKMAAALADLGVDIMEAGFPIASEGDFEAVDAVSRRFPWMQVAALSRACTLDVERAAKALEHAKRPR